MKVHLISSRFPVLAIASSWIVAVLCGSAFSIDSKVVYKNGALDCTEETTTISQYAVALPTAPVNGNVQRKRQAMKMSICVVAVFIYV